MSSFQSQLESFAKKTNQRIDVVVRKTCLELSNSIVKKTPVDKGMARNNWMPSINRVDRTVGPMSHPDARIRAASKKAYGNIYYLTNSLPYIKKLEFGGYSGPTGKVTSAGFSRKAPNGMVRLTMQEFRKVINKAIYESR